MSDHPPAPKPRTPHGIAGLVLVVDDDRLVRASTMRLLRSLEIATSEAAGGADAIAIVTATPQAFSCVLLDLTMPGMSGDETFHALRRLRTELPIVLTTGQLHGNEIDALLLLGNVAYLAKPYGRATLVEAMGRALAR